MCFSAIPFSQKWLYWRCKRVDMLSPLFLILISIHFATKNQSIVLLLVFPYQTFCGNTGVFELPQGCLGRDCQCSSSSNCSGCNYDTTMSTKGFIPVRPESQVSAIYPEVRILAVLHSAHHSSLQFLVFRRSPVVGGPEKALIAG